MRQIKCPASRSRYYCLILAVIVALFVWGAYQKTVQIHADLLSRCQQERMRRLLLNASAGSVVGKEALQALAAYLVVGHGLVGDSLQYGEAPAYVLLETMGQLMEYAVLVQDEPLFSAAWQRIEKYMRAEEGYYYWRIKAAPPHQPDEATALIDLLRPLRALMLAETVFQKPAYRKDAYRLATSIYTFNRDGDFLIDAYDGRTGKREQKLSLFYVDPLALDCLAELLPQAAAVCRNTLAVLQEAPVNEHGFFPNYYDTDSLVYVAGAEVNMVECLYTAHMIRQAGGETKALAEFLRRQLELYGKIFNHYTYKDATPLGDTESTALYALAARLFEKSGDRAAAVLAWQRMLDFRIGEGGGTLAWGFGDPGSATLYAFDQLETLLAIILLGESSFEK